MQVNTLVFITVLGLQKHGAENIKSFDIPVVMSYACPLHSINIPHQNGTISTSKQNFSLEICYCASLSQKDKCMLSLICGSYGEYKRHSGMKWTCCDLIVGLSPCLYFCQTVVFLIIAYQFYC